MIAYLRGTVIHVGHDGVVVDVGGVGYEVLLDRLALSAIEGDGAAVGLFIRTVVRDDAITLYGFPQVLGREVFDLLVTVTGIGPRLASQILGGMPLPDLVRAVRDKDVRALATLPGVGRKLAERLALELSEKFVALGVEAEGEGRGATRAGGVLDDVRSALLNLGFGAREVEAAVRSLEPGDKESIEGLIRQAIAFLNTRT